jgi:hypothetical protein
LSDLKILVSGCGITYSKQKVQTWPNIFRLLGCTIVDVGGPAVSNQWIINKTFLELQDDVDLIQFFQAFPNDENLDESLKMSTSHPSAKAVMQTKKARRSS